MRETEIAESEGDFIKQQTSKALFNESTNNSQNKDRQIHI